MKHYIVSTYRTRNGIPSFSRLIEANSLFDALSTYRELIAGKEDEFIIGDEIDWDPDKYFIFDSSFDSVDKNKLGIWIDIRDCKHTIFHPKRIIPDLEDKLYPEHPYKEIMTLRDTSEDYLASVMAITSFSILAGRSAGFSAFKDYCREWGDEYATLEREKTLDIELEKFGGYYIWTMGRGWLYFVDADHHARFCAAFS